jgi:YidC/Oxa1 family membrane protein insertase
MPLANVLQPLIDVFEAFLVFIHDNLSLGWGFSIVVMTIVIRALLLPLTLKQVRSMRGMQQIAPQMKVLRDKHKEDPQRLNQEMMKLYREHKVNPFASCLPILAQLPVFISLFYLLREDLRRDICPDINPEGSESTRPCGESPESDFLFVPDITDNATGGVLVTLVVLYVGSQLASSLLMTMTADRNQRIIFIALPFLFVPFVLSFPAGLLVYWITTNTWTIVQQFIVRRTVGPMPPPDLSILGGGGGGSGKDKGASDGDGGGGGGKARRGGVAARAGADGNGRAEDGAGAVSIGAPRGRTAAPPPPPRKKKKQRSGRRR